MSPADIARVRVETTRRAHHAARRATERALRAEQLALQAYALARVELSRAETP